MNTALIVIDAQNIYTQQNADLACEDASKTIEKINELIEHFEKKKMPIIYFRHIHKSDGSDLGRMFDYEGEPAESFNFKEGTKDVEYDSRVRKALNGKEYIKKRYSCFVNTGLNNYLKENKIECVVICGFMTNFCCESTARDAHDLDYFVDFIIDATGTPGTDNLDQKKIREVVGELLGEGFARVSTTMEYISNN